MLYTSLVLCLWTLVGVIGTEVKLVYEGDSVTLYTDITELQRGTEIEWKFEEIRIARIRRLLNINPTYDNNDKTQIFKDRLKMNNQTGDLIITDITTQHTGLYKLNIIIGHQETVKRFNVNVNDLHTVRRLLSQPTVVICFVVGASQIILASGLIFWIYKKHKNKHQKDQSGEDEDAYANTTFRKLNAQTKKSEITEVVYTFYTIETDQTPLLP